MRGECLISLVGRPGDLENRIARSGKIANAKLTKPNEEMKERRETLAKKNTAIRNRLQESKQKEFVICMAKPPGEVELRKARFASHFQGIVNAGVEITPENEARIEEDHLSDMGMGLILEVRSFRMRHGVQRKKSRL